MKHIKLFESFDLGEELTGGEKAAQSRGDEIMTEEQAAFCYVLALGISKELNIPGSDSRFEQVVPMEEWPEWVDMKAESIRRAVEKFTALINEEEDGILIYPKIRRFHAQFADMSDEDLLLLAGDAIDKPDDALKTKYKKKLTFDQKDVENAGKMIQGNLTLPFVKGNINKAIETYAKSKLIPIEDAKKLYIEFKRKYKKFS